MPIGVILIKLNLSNLSPHAHKSDFDKIFYNPEIANFLMSDFWSLRSYLISTDMLCCVNVYKIALGLNDDRRVL